MTRDVSAIAPPVEVPEYEVIYDTSITKFNTKLNDMVMNGWMVDGDTVIAYSTHSTISPSPSFAQRMKRIKQ